MLLARCARCGCGLRSFTPPPSPLRPIRRFSHARYAAAAAPSSPHFRRAKPVRPPASSSFSSPLRERIRPCVHLAISPSRENAGILQLLLPQREGDAQAATVPTQQQAEQQPPASHPPSSQASAVSAAEEQEEEEELPLTLLEQLRPQQVEDASIAAIIREIPPPTLQPEPATGDDPPSSSSSSSAADSAALSLSSAALPHSPAPSPAVEPARESWREELAALDAAALDEDDEEMRRYLTAPLSAPPSFDEMQAEIDSLLGIEIRGRVMFPLYMRDRLRLLCLSHMHRVITALLASAQPYTEHELHSRLFSHLVKHAAKLARTEDERISILCPDAPMLGAKVPHPQWPELATVMRRYFTTAAEASMEIDTEGESEAVVSGRIRLSDLFSGIDSGPAPAADSDDIVFDLDSIDEAALSRDMDAEDAQRDAASPSREQMSSSQRAMFDMQREAREQAKELMGKRLRALKKRRQLYLRTQADIAAAAADGRGSSAAVVRGGKEKEKEKQGVEQEDADEDDPLSLTVRGAPRMLAVVYRFDSGDEFEMRYPLSRKDIKRLSLAQEEDGNNDIVIR